MNTSTPQTRPSLGRMAAVKSETSRLLAEKKVKPKTLFDLMYDGFYALFLLRNGSIPDHEPDFRANMIGFLEQFELEAKKMNAAPDDIYDAKYAFCAAVDEMVLRINSAIRETWERKPLQLMLFGDQLAGEHFFEILEQLRAQGASRIQALEIYYMCLLLGFEGKYWLESHEKLHYLTARLGDEIAAHKGKAKGFAPRWERPDQLTHHLRQEIPLWVIGCIFLLVSIASYLLFLNHLTTLTESSLAPYNEIIEMAPKAAHLLIILP